MSRRTVIVIFCLLIALLTLKRGNRSIGDAESMLIMKLLENGRAAEVFNISGEGIYT